MQDYRSIPGFEHYYLEESYVSRIWWDEDHIEIWLDAVLTQDHPDFQPPREGEIYSWRHSEIIFTNVKRCQWFDLNVTANYDPAGADIGCIYAIDYANGRYYLRADFGTAEIESSAPTIGDLSLVPDNLMRQNELRTRVIVVTDGKRGHENQSRVLARMLGENEEDHQIVMQLRPEVRNGGFIEFILRMRLALAGPGSVSKREALRLVQRWLKPEYPRVLRSLGDEVKEARTEGKSPPRIFVVSTGTPPATFNLLLARLLDAEPVVCMTPSLQRRSNFALNVVPAQDVRDGADLPPNVLATPLALAWHDSARAQQLAWQLRQRCELPADAQYIGLAVGGPTKHAPWGEREMLSFLDHLREGVPLRPSPGSQEGPPRRVIATNSRRTPASVTAKLRELADSGALAAFVDANEDTVNPLPAFYELCQAVWITADSFSMLSEAVNAGHQPVVLTLGASLKGKLARTLVALELSGGVLLQVDAGGMRGGAAAARRRGEPNRAMLELQALVRERLGL